MNEGHVFVLLREDPYGEAAPHVQALFFTLEGAKKSVTPRKEGRAAYGWRQHGATGQWYFGRTDTKGDDWGREFSVQSWAVYP